MPNMDKRSIASIDEYIAQFKPGVQAILRRLRKLIRETAPTATEKISYQVPTFVLHGNPVYFAAFKRHIGFYPGASAVAAFDGELTAYKRGKGSIQFPIDKPLPLDLIRRIVELRLTENPARDAMRKKKG